MSMIHLNTRQLHDAILAGCQYLVSQGANLNKINVFPVADGDTGDNMASTARAILTFSAEKSSIDETLQSVADASVIGARGNSGIIFSQFFNALAEGAIKKEHIDIHDFSKLLTQAAVNVRAAIASPIEGTILTLIDAWAKTFNKLLIKSHLFNDVMKEILPALRQTVDSTTDTLLALKKANVVDAGALGFYHFVNGFSDCLNLLKPPVYTPTLIEPCHVEHDTPLIDNPPIHRYCTEAVFNPQHIDKAQLIQLLNEHGDSAAVTGNDRLCRFHVHTNNPRAIFSHLLNHGTIQYPKIDDMNRQFEVIHQRKHSIALVTDSGADIPTVLQDHYQIHQLSLNIHFGESDLLDRYCLDPNLFYQSALELESHPKTSCPPPAFFKEKLRNLSNQYEHVLVISISKELSGTLDVITQAAQEYSNVTVIDSQTTSGAQGLLLDYAGQLIDAGTPFETVVDLVKAAINNTSVLVMVDELDCLMRSGRVSKLTGRVAQFLGMKPIITINKEGRGAVVGKSFNKNKALNKLITMVKNQLRQSNASLEQYCIVHAGVEEQAHEFAKLTTKIFKQSPAYIEPVSPVIGLHAGQGCIGLAVRMR